MLVAQARVEDLTLVSSDSKLERYDVRLLPAGA
jgi:PIN domain nuclease of toxin-antitoxin system